MQKGGQKKIRTIPKHLVPVVLSLAMVLTAVFSIWSFKDLQGNARVINYTGIVRGASQRVVKQELNGVPNDELIDRLDNILTELSTGKGENDIIRMDDPDFQSLLLQMREAWKDCKHEIYQFREGAAPDTLYQKSESFFELADRTVSAAELYSEECVQRTKYVLIAMNVVFIGLAVLCGISARILLNRRKNLLEAEDINRTKSRQLNQMFHDIRAPMDEISELMYVSDIETHEILFINSAGKEMFHIDNPQGKKCYEALMGLDAPCPYCSTPYLKENENYTWEFTNPILKRHYLLKDRLIQWEGRRARMEIAFDMTESENEKNELKNMLDSERVIVECIRELYQNPNPDLAAENVIKKIGKYLSADRVYVVDILGSEVSNILEWCGEGVKSFKSFSHEFSKPLYHDWFQLLQNHESVILDKPDDFLRYFPENFSHSGPRDLQRMLAVPLERDGILEGFIGVDNLPAECLKNADSILQTLRYFLMLARRRAEDEKKLAILSYHDTLTSFFNRNRYIQEVERLSKEDGPVGIVFIDINGLKEINDQFGHDAGDDLLKECARNMEEVFQNGDF